MRRYMLAAAVGFFALGCGNYISGPNALLTGTWHGVENGVRWNLKITESGGSLTGSGSAIGFGSTTPITIEGTVVRSGGVDADADVDISFLSGNVLVATYAGTMADQNGIDGTVTSVSGNSAELQFTR